MSLSGIKLRALVILLLVGAFAGSGNAAVPATAAPNSSDRIALVIGNAAYQGAPLANPVNDATDIAASLRRLGFRVTLATNVNRMQMRAAIRDFGMALRRGQVGFFFFAGHGIESKGRNFLVPLATSFTNEFELEDEAVDANSVLNAMEEAGNPTNIVVLDACRDNPFARSWRSTSRGLAQMNAPNGSFIAFATAPGSVAADGSGRNGTFTKNLLASLNRPDLDIDRVFTRVTKAVSEETGKKQVPWRSSSLTAEFSFALGSPVTSIGPAPVPAADLSANDRALWDSVKDSKNPNEFRAYLNQFPRGLFAELANERLKGLQTAATPPPTATPTSTPAPAPKTQPQASVQPSAPKASSPAPVATITPKASVAATQTPAGSPGAGKVFKDCPECPEMVVIPVGSFQMGSDMSGNQMVDLGPPHQVRISRAFAMAKYEITTSQFARFVQESDHANDFCEEWNGSNWTKEARRNWRNPGFAQGDNSPVTCVSWNDAKAYVEWLSRKTGQRYRLPTESEWEYAARGGTTTLFDSQGKIQITPRHANYDTRNSFDVELVAHTEPVGSFAANPFGLYDMHGNVAEWTEDCYVRNYYNAPKDESARVAKDCTKHVLRGGSWETRPQVLTSYWRFSAVTERVVNTNGIRIARSD